MFRKLNNRAQSLSEYAILIGIIVFSLTAMQTIVKRNLQAKFYDIVEDFKTYDELPGQKSLFRKELGSYTTSNTETKMNLSQGKIAGFDTFSREADFDKILQNQTYIYESYEEEQPD